MTSSWQQKSTIFSLICKANSCLWISHIHDGKIAGHSILSVHSAIVRQLADRKLYNANMWFVYALYNAENNKIYIGQTANIDKRFTEHNHKRGNHYTAKITGDWILIYTEQVFDKREALIREKQLKSFRGRAFIKKYIPR